MSLERRTDSLGEILNTGLNIGFVKLLKTSCLNLQSPSVGLLDHTGYPNLHPGVHGPLAFSGRKDGGLNVLKVIWDIQTMQGYRNSILMK